MSVTDLCRPWGFLKQAPALLSRHVPRPLQPICQLIRLPLDESSEEPLDGVRVGRDRVLLVVVLGGAPLCPRMGNSDGISRLVFWSSVAGSCAGASPPTHHVNHELGSLSLKKRTFDLDD
jgi:hypothetical protein